MRALSLQVSLLALSLLLLAFASASLPSGVYPSHAGAPSLSCSFAGVDYSSLSNIYFSMQESSLNRSYSVQVCRGLIWDPPQPQSAEASCIWLTSFAAVCIVDSTLATEQGPATYGAGEWSTAAWSSLAPDSSGVAIALVGERSCTADSGALVHWNSTIEMQCGPALTSLTVTQIDACTHTFAFQTPLACTAEDRIREA